MKKKITHKDKTLSFRLEPELYKFFEDTAEESNLSLSLLMRNVCKQWSVFAKDTSDKAKQATRLTIDGKNVNVVILFDPKDRELMTSTFANKKV